MVRALDEGIGTEQRIKVPPNSVEAEQSLIGGLMLDAQAWDKIADVISAEDLYRRDHRIIFAAIAELVEEGSPCDVVTVSERLEKRGELADAGGLEYLATLANETPGAANARAYARILRDRSIERALINVGNEIAGSAFATDGRSASELVDEAERLVFEIAERGARSRHFDGVCKIRRADSRIAEGRSRHRGRAPFDGQNDIGDQYRRERGHRRQGPDGDLLYGNAVAAAGLSNDFVAGPC
jgi:replicative DNA helicase